MCLIVAFIGPNVKAVSLILNSDYIRYFYLPSFKNYELGSGALSGKMLLVRIMENNKSDANFRAG